MNTSTRQTVNQRRLTNFAVENSHQNAKLGEKWKKWLQNWCGGVTLSLCLSALAATQVQAATYSFTKIADTKSFPWQSISNPVINDSGTVAFLVTSTRQSQYISGYKIVYTSNGNQLTEIVNSDNLPSLLFASSEFPGGRNYFLNSVEGINNNGTIAFTAFHRGIDIFTTSQNGFTTRRAFGTISLGGGTVEVSQPRLNDLEEVVYLERSFAFNTNTIVLSRPNSFGNRLIARGNSGSYPPPPPNVLFSEFSSFDINNNSEVVFAATSRDGTKAIYTNRGGSVSPLVETGANALDINDSGDVALLTGNTIRLFHRATGILNAIANTSGQFRGFGNPVINNSGKVAFAATLALGESGIFTGADPVNDKVIASGDTLFGSTVKSVRFSRQGLNNQGQIVFLAE
ncbi:DUF7453 family protein, partial [Iningainema tapete]